MPQGQFTSADVAQSSSPSGRFTSADIDASPEQTKSDSFWLDLAHRLVLNNPVSAGKGIIGAGGVIEGAKPEGEFKWSDAHPSLHNLIQNTADELKRTFAPNAGTAVGNLISLGQAARPVSPGTIAGVASAARPAVSTALRTASDVIDPEITGIVSPRLAHLQRTAGKVATALDKMPAKTQPAAPLTPAEAAEGSTWRQPDNLAPSPLRAQSQANIPQPAESAYPTGLQKRPTDRAEITSDKAIEDAMRNNLERQGWQALSQERKEFYANNQPGMSKGDLVTNARVEAVRTAAEQEVQKILAESTRPVKFTKTVIPKAKVPAAQPVATGDPNTDLVDILQRSIDAVNARKGNK